MGNTLYQHYVQSVDSGVRAEIYFAKADVVQAELRRAKLVDIADRTSLSFASLVLELAADEGFSQWAEEIYQRKLPPSSLQKLGKDLVKCLLDYAMGLQRGRSQAGRWRDSIGRESEAEISARRCRRDRDEEQDRRMAYREEEEEDDDEDEETVADWDDYNASNKARRRGGKAQGRQGLRPPGFRNKALSMHDRHSYNRSRLPSTTGRRCIEMQVSLQSRKLLPLPSLTQPPYPTETYREDACRHEE